MTTDQAAGRECLLDQAQRLFFAHGYHGVSVRDIVQACGLSNAALYYHFAEGKQALLRAVVAGAASAHLAGLYVLAFVGAAGVAVSMYFYLRWIREMYFEAPEPLVADVPEPGVPDAPPPAAPSLAERLDGAGADALARAWAGLYRLWGYDSAAATDEQACAQALTAGLSCLDGAGSWGLLRRFDRPAILQLQAGSGQPVAALLQQIDGDQLVLEVDGEVVRVPRAELEKSWYGTYRLLWKKPPSGYVLLRPGMRNKDVPWLRERLSRVNGRETATADRALYDESLVSEVIALQRRHGLVADGYAGAHTLILLNNLIADPEIPYLVGDAATPSE